MCYSYGMCATRVERIGIRELRQNASHYVDLVRTKGVVVEITNRGRLAARMVSAEEAENEYGSLVASGVVEPAKRPGHLLDIEPDPLEPGHLPPSADIIREREESPW